jgi:emfourin
MTLTMEIAGGLVPPATARRLVVDASTLDEAERALLIQLVDAAFRVPQRPPNAAARDARRYEIVVSEAGTRRIVAQDGSMDPAVRRLIERIEMLNAGC